MLEVLAISENIELFLLGVVNKKQNFLQETHTIKNCESQWRKEWGSSIMFSHGRTNARGVAVLIRSGLDIAIQHEHCDSKGRLIMLNAKIIDKKLLSDKPLWSE